MSNILDLLSFKSKQSSSLLQYVRGFLTTLKVIEDSGDQYAKGAGALRRAWSHYLAKYNDGYWATAVIPCFEADLDHESQAIRWGKTYLLPVHTGLDANDPTTLPFLKGLGHIYMEGHQELPRFAKKANEIPVDLFEAWMWRMAQRPEGATGAVQQMLYAGILIEAYEAGFRTEGFELTDHSLEIKLLGERTWLSVFIDYKGFDLVDAQFRKHTLAQGIDIDDPVEDNGHD